MTFFTAKTRTRMAKIAKSQIEIKVSTATAASCRIHVVPWLHLLTLNKRHKTFENYFH